MVSREGFGSHHSVLRGRGEGSGDEGGEDTPVPMPNTEVKLPSAEDTWRGTARETRTLPVFLGPMVKRSRHRPFTAVTRVRFPVGSPKETSDFQRESGVFICFTIKLKRRFILSEQYV